MTRTRDWGGSELEGRLRHTAAIIESVLRDPRPADYLFAQYARETRMVSEDKPVVSTYVNVTLRYWLRYEPIVRKHHIPGRSRIYAAILLSLARSSRELPKGMLATIERLARLRREAIERLLSDGSAEPIFDEGAAEADRLAIPRGFQPWVSELLLADYSPAEIERVLDGLNTTALTSLRANSLKTTREELKERLKQEGIRTRPGRFSPDALIVREGGDLFATAAFREGLFEVQDEGSQIVSLLTAPSKGSRVLDACAGSGGKSLHLGALMKGRGDVFAFDTDKRRLANASKRIKRSGLQNVRVLDTPERFDNFVSRHAGGLDTVLIDAPCTGLGTVRRSPDIKLRANPALLERMTGKQRGILEQFAPYVRVGGRVVYATCSILSEENERIIEGFLQSHPEFELVPLEQVLRESELISNLEPEGDTLRLYPHMHGTDGFFAAVMQRR